MANDGGVTALIEQAAADVLAALQFNGENVFKAAEVWKYQIAAAAGGIEAFSKYEPFAFVSYLPISGFREGDNDLRQVLIFAVAIGVESKTAGVARIGDAKNLGISKIRDLVIAALDNWHPGGSIACDPLYYKDEIALVDDAHRNALQMHFEANMITL